jgi:hypothetical protein
MVADGERDVQAPPVIGTAQSVKPWPNRAVSGIGEHQQRLVEKDLLGFCLTNPVPVHTLARVSGVPLKAFAPRQIDHRVYMTHIYNSGQLWNSMIWSRCAVTDMLAQ